jgi:hypothetical protein
MSRVSNLAFVGSLLGLLLFSLAAVAEPTSSPPQKDLKLSTAPPPPTPLPESYVSETDADQVGAEIGRRERDNKLIREEILEPHRRPDLEYDVVSGIQSRNANKTLGRR